MWIPVGKCLVRDHRRERLCYSSLGCTLQRLPSPQNATASVLISQSPFTSTDRTASLSPVPGAIPGGLPHILVFQSNIPSRSSQGRLHTQEEGDKGLKSQFYLHVDLGSLFWLTSNAVMSCPSQFNEEIFCCVFFLLKKVKEGVRYLCNTFPKPQAITGFTKAEEFDC